ncbi:MAG: SGNH/GDSL hydrolase family protein [Pirellulaceae bacterium]|nr:SGNH/GDSL hydrolase family protein [Pirellulaceae bacterium]
MLNRTTILQLIFILILTAIPAKASGWLDAITQKLESGQPVTIATFGDSITWPCYHTDYEQNYITFTVDALRKTYSNADIKIVHAGNMGSTGRGLQKTRFQRYVLEHQPDVVFIMFGMNDCGARSKGLESFDQNLVRLIDMTRGIGAIPVLCTQNTIIYDSVDGRRREYLPQYRSRILDVGHRTDTPVVDCFADWQRLSEEQLIGRLNDWIHPNHAGHRLLAHSILKTLWPDAVGHLSIEIATPARQPRGDAQPQLLPGPEGKQVLCAQNGLWCTVSGRSVGQQSRDLVFSWSRKKRPQWKDFQHLTLVGPPDTSVFDHMDRTLTSAMLLEREGRICILFGWRVGIFMLSIRPEDLPDSADKEQLRQLQLPDVWLQHTRPLFVRPSEVAHANYRPGGILYDAYDQREPWPYVLCRHIKKSPGTGGEVVEGEDAIALVTRDHGPDTRKLDLLFTSSGDIRVTTAADGQRYFVAQHTANGPIQVGRIGSEPLQTIDQPFDRVIVPEYGAEATGVVRRARSEASENPHWLKLTWGRDKLAELVQLEAPQPSFVGMPLPWSDGVSDEILWYEFADGLPDSRFSFSSRIPQGTDVLGVLSERTKEMFFEAVDIR